MNDQISSIESCVVFVIPSFPSLSFLCKIFTILNINTCMVENFFSDSLGCLFTLLVIPYDMPEI